MDFRKKELLKAVWTGFADEKVNSAKELQPELIYNDTEQGKTVIACLEENLKTAESFYFITAFITKSGLIMLKDCLKMLAKKGIKGKVLTTDYLYFSEPAAIEELNKFSNIEMRICTGDNFHIKGYVFSKKDTDTFIIGSSNMTQNALKVNKEWNIKFTCLKNGQLSNNIKKDINKLWNNASILTGKWLEKYKINYLSIRKIYQEHNMLHNDVVPLTANAMQKKVLQALTEMRFQQKNKALLISATGTGKTILSAMDVKQFKPHKMLFVAHREQILHQAEASYRRVMGNDISTGFLAADKRNFAADFIFATINTIAKDDILNQFAPTYFNYIIIDETHRAGAVSYQKVIDYFRPSFLLGMTATPERTDNFDIYNIFGNNIAYEIRLQEAMKDDMLCPFHYFGLADIEINGQKITDDVSFNDLVSAERINHIIEQAGFYGYSGERVRGLVFCRNIDEAKELSRQFNKRGFYTTALSAATPAGLRDKAVLQLEQEKRENGLDYIFSVDIMNEGIDIPNINQIIMLRPTKSPIVFVQQMGRGLRKYKGKEYVVILDFIGNYDNNFMIPMALFGDNSCNKDDMRRCIGEGKTMLYGPSTVSFDLIAQKRIYESIDKARLNNTALLKKAYEDLKNKLGRIPELNDFAYFGTIDIMKYIDKFGSYYSFLQKYEREYNIRFNNVQEEILLFICRRFARGKRVYEIEALKLLLQYDDKFFSHLQETLAVNYNLGMSDEVKKSIINNLTNVFTISNEQQKYQHCVFIKKKNDGYVIADEFKECIQDKDYKAELEGILLLAETRYKKEYVNNYKDTSLCLYKKYTYEEVCYLLNWPQKINPNAMAGYFYEKTTHTMPVFINYMRPDEKRVAYANKFISDKQITAYSKLNRKLDSHDARHIYEAEKENNHIFLFLRKRHDDRENKEFYFLGEIRAVGRPVAAPQYNGFKIVYELITPVRADLFAYLTS
ncbi:DUF3427 domain-containing protein [Pectinatus sottacetonis]|uniref:DUF3427 domain-containing protein n=1 Tax=Pectinatus sottacetonis TaxID=1002795 RepID=UPI001E3CCFCD|nr:DEAD/DEAH box helicase [Pectinatus sottacetonis]